MPNRAPLVLRSTRILGLTLLVLSSRSFGFNSGNPTALEWNALPDHCRVENPRVFRAPPGANQHRLNEQDSKTRWIGGLWHYCAGLVKLMRAELGSVRMTEGLANEIMGDIDHSLKGLINGGREGHPWTIEMLIAQARVKRLQRQREEALELLEQLRKEHPGFPAIYTTYASVLFDDKRYAEALPVLADGNRATGDQFPEIQYFLGLGYFRNGDITNARTYEKKAREGGYPFRYLTRKLAEHDAKKLRSGR